MKFLRCLLALVFVSSLTSFSQAQAASDSDSPTAVVQALYHSASKHFGFDADTIKANKPYLTPELYARLVKKVNVPTAKGDAPDIEGDLFLNCQDAPNKYVVGKATTDDAQAKVDVDLFWSGTPGEKTHLVVLLKQVKGAWKVDDVDYGKDGKLTDQLK